MESSIETDRLVMKLVWRLRWRIVISCCDCVDRYSTCVLKLTSLLQRDYTVHLN